MSSRQSAYAALASSTSPFPGRPVGPIPPLPTRAYTDPVKPKPLPLDLPQLSESFSDLSLHIDPPINPRKARRRCANFGFSREPLLFQGDASLSVSSSFLASADNDTLTSPGPTPPGTFTSTDSDVSSFSDLSLDFPQPPPINLRRMQSSPQFTLPDNAASRSRDVKRWGTVPPVPTGELWKRRDSLTDLEAELEFLPPFDQSTESYRGRIAGLTEALESVIQTDLKPPVHPRRDSAVFQDLPAASKSSLVLDKTTTRDIPQSRSEPFAHFFPSYTTTPTHSQNRSDSFVRPTSTTQKIPVNPPVPPTKPILPRQISKMRSLKFAPECNSSLDRLDITLQNSKPSKSVFRGRSISMDFPENHRALSMLPASNQPKSASYLPSMGPVPVQRMTMNPPTMKNRTFSANGERNGVLSTPFLHRPPSSSTRPDPRSSLCAPSAGLKSFIDITPEQARRKSTLGHRDRVKKLLSRASQVFDWKKKKANAAN